MAARNLELRAGVFYLGVYGGYDHEGVWQDDQYEPKRFFSFYTDEHLQQIVAEVFEILSFRCIPLENSDLHFQALALRKQGGKHPQQPAPDRACTLTEL